MNNQFNSISKMLSLLKVRKTGSYIKNNLYSHPDYPSILSLSETMEKYQINTLAVKIGEEKLEDIPLPCFVQVSKDGKTLLHILKEINVDNISYYNEHNSLKTSFRKDFLKRWTGICLLVEKTKFSKEPGIEKSLKRKKTITFLSTCTITLVLILFVFRIEHISNERILYFFYSAYVIIKLIGLLIAATLLWHEVDKSNPALQKICAPKKNVDCNSVLGSNYASLFKGNISLSSIVFGYFFASIALLFLNISSLSFLNILKLSSIATIPWALYSIYLQKFKIHKWCKLCLALIPILGLEYILIGFTKIQPLEIRIYDVLVFTTFFLAPILFWGLLKRSVNNTKKTIALERSLKAMKMNKTVFKSLLLSSKRITTNPNGLGIHLKKKESKYKVLKVCNPYCDPCAKAHPVLEELYQKGIIDLQILFTSKADEKDKRYKPVSHLLALNEIRPKNILKALDDWYTAELKDYNLFAEKHQLKGQQDQQKKKIQKMNDWCRSENISHTPTIYIDDFKLTKDYNVADLRELLQ